MPGLHRIVIRTLRVFAWCIAGIVLAHELSRARDVLLARARATGSAGH